MAVPKVTRPASAALAALSSALGSRPWLARRSASLALSRASANPILPTGAIVCRVGLPPKRA